jgi:hypothetical protein
MGPCDKYIDILYSETTELIESNYDHLKVNKKLYVLNADRRYKMMYIAEYSFNTDVKSEVSGWDIIVI